MFALALPVAGCAQEGPKESKKAVAVKTAADHFTISVGDRPVAMQLAVLDAEMQRGLMGRTNLGPNEGMLFVYAFPQRMSFWMRNTPTPLDIGFFSSEGILHEVRAMYPFDDTPVPSRSSEIRYALEMNQGWFEANGVRPGARLDLTALKAALKERGFQAEIYVENH